MRRWLSVLMVIGVLVAVAVPTAFVHAAPETDIGPLAEGPCPIYGVHQMVSQGPAVVKDVNNGAQLFTGGGTNAIAGNALFVRVIRMLGDP